MIDIQFEINGRKVDPRRVAYELERALLSEVVDSIQSDIRGVRCPTHHREPEVVCRGRSIDRLRIEVSGCCDDLVERAVARLS